MADNNRARSRPTGPASRLRPATPVRANRPLRPMPRQNRTPKGGTAATARGPRRRSFPLSPVAVVLGLALVIAVAAAWYFEGRYEIPPAEAAKQLVPYKGDDIQTLELVTPAGQAVFNRGADGKFDVNGASPTPEAAAGAGATLPAVSLSPGARVQSVVNQLAGMRIERVLLSEPSTSADYGLDRPQMVLTVETKRGQETTLAIGGLNPDETSYYVRREQQRDTVLVSRYIMDDLLKIAQELAG